MENKTNIFALTKQDTAVLKGIAIIAMLMHHLWGCPPIGVEPYTGVLGFLGSVGKVCVAMFLFCSGYGLSVGYGRLIEDGRLNGQSPNEDWKIGLKDTLKFLARRFVKFYAGYWPIFLIFVPISIWGFERSLADAYGTDENVYKCLAFDVLGIGGFHSYNITWWFNQLLIEAYLLFPILFWLAKKWPWTLLVLTAIITPLQFVLKQYGGNELWVNIQAFLFGILWFMHEERLEKLYTLISKSWVWIVLSVIFMVSCLWMRGGGVPHIGGGRIDAFLTLSLAGSVVFILRQSRFVMRTLTVLGKHSGNTYMIHTFIYAYWFPCTFYSCEARGGHGYNSPSDRMSLTKYHYGTREGDVEMESVFKDSAK